MHFYSIQFLIMAFKGIPFLFLQGFYFLTFRTLDVMLLWTIGVSFGV